MTKVELLCPGILRRYDGSLKRFDYLYTVSDMLRRTVQRSFLMIVIPNTFCIIGAMTGVFGLASSLVLNNGFNFLAALNGALPLMEQSETTSPNETQPKAIAELGQELVSECRLKYKKVVCFGHLAIRIAVV